MTQSPPVIHTGNPSLPKAVVITGASSGIGRACALRLDELGWQIFVGVRTQADAEALRQASPRLTPLFLDVTQPDTIAASAQIVSEVVGPTGLFGLVNNAGIARGGPLEFLPIDELRRQFEVNVLGQIAVTQALLPLLRAGRGRIVNMGSISGKIALPLLGPYAASKFALEALTDALRIELSFWDIHVSIIEPGPINTPIWAKSLSTFETMTKAWPPQAQDLYGQAMEVVRKVINQSAQNAAPVDEVVRAVIHALTARRPKTRYPVGRWAATTIWLFKLLPDRLRDWLIMQRR